MTKNNNKLFTLNKKQVLATILAFTMATSLGACKKSENTTEATTIQTTVATTTQTTTPTTTPVVTVDYTSAAEKLYEDNKEFFINQYGEDKESAINELIDVISIITDTDSQKITIQNQEKAFYAIDTMFMPTNVVQAAGNYMTGEPVEHVERIPDLSVFLKDDQAKSLVYENTVIVNKFIDALNNGTDEEKAQARVLLIQKAITLEEDLDEKYYLGELSDGDELASLMSIKGVVNLAGTTLENGLATYLNKDGVEQRRQLIPNTYQAAVLNTFRFATAEGIPFDTKEIDGAIVNGRYVEYLGANGFEQDFVTYAEYKDIESLIAITKYEYAINDLEVEYSNKSAEYYTLNNDCVKSLTI